ncbi:DinB family protein [Sediminibacillus terrae]|uniref:DinB family protein n=1 Tax=Sediminibacillus terrae TaxID=1562106 RepID=UPI000418AAA1|nr:DinB family protein [Sediminibacillus terrae]
MSKVEEIRDSWYSHRQVLQELLEKIDDKHVDFKPWDGAFTLGGLAVHLATSMEMFTKSTKEGVFTFPDSKPEFETLQDVRNIVDNYTQTTLKLFESISDHHLDKRLEMNGFDAPAAVWLGNARDHEIHHKGQLFTYARMAGVEEVPFFMKQPTKG